MVPAAGFSVSLFDVRGIARSLSPSNLPAFYNLTAGIRRADRLFRRIEPSVVVSVGGYASVPAVMAAKIRRIPVLVVELRRRAGQGQPPGGPPGHGQRRRLRLVAAARARW